MENRGIKRPEINPVIPVLAPACKYRLFSLSEEVLNVLEASPITLMIMDCQGRIFNEAGIDTSPQPEGAASLSLKGRTASIA